MSRPTSTGTGGALLALLACCGVKLLVLAALIAPAGFLTRNTVIGVIGLLIAAGLVWWAIRRRHKCDGTCHLSEPQEQKPSQRQQ
jgi:high-affinity Fe2+/Pb2+ permease